MVGAMPMVDGGSRAILAIGQENFVMAIAKIAKNDCQNFLKK